MGAATAIGALRRARHDHRHAEAAKLSPRLQIAAHASRTRYSYRPGSSNVFASSTLVLS
jgi:hypothetical protein